MNSLMKTVVLSMLLLPLLAGNAPAQEGPAAPRGMGHGKMEHGKKGECPMCQERMKSAKDLAAIKEILIDAGVTAKAENAGDTAERIETALELIEDHHAKMHAKMKDHVGMAHPDMASMPKCPMCAAGSSAKDGTMKSGTTKTLNRHCPMTGEALEGELKSDHLASWEGGKLGFCCPACVEKWSALSSQERVKRLAMVKKGSLPEEMKFTCPGKADTADDSGSDSEMVAVVNVRCPIMGKALAEEGVAANLIREFEGKTVGFCCGGCPTKWDRLSDEEKQEKLRKAID